MQKIIKKEDIKIEEMIYEVNGVQVMTDFDLASLFEVETKRINEAVKNNQRKFPNKYSWKLNELDSKKFLVENFDQKNIERRGGRYKSPRVFTEHGIVMLSTILKSDIAIEMSIRIIDAFVKMRHFIRDNADIFKSLNLVNNRLIEHDEKIDYLFSKFDKKEKVLLKGEVFEAYTSVLEILNTASREIIIVDNYADIYLLELIKNIDCNITLITRNSDRLSNIEIKKYNEEYHNLKVIRNNDFHDRIIVIDNKEIYLLGSSINSLGEKTTFIVEINDIKIKDVLLKNIKKILENNDFF